ncbi:MAG: alpha/beta fold hydrolase [SAR202 cluster bacterium]|nr:alpha/beta fold hydrolase [SAR202 cluster bacterium]
MTFATPGGLTEQGTSKHFKDKSGMSVHYHDIGRGPPVVFLHVWGPGSTAWLTWHKVVDDFAKHFRCLLLDFLNFGKTGPLRYNEPAHSAQTKVVRSLMEHLGIDKAMFVGHSMGGTTALVQAIEAPCSVTRIVLGGSHASTGGDPYIIANFPSEGSVAARDTYADPTRDNFKRYLRAHIHDAEMASDPRLLDYVHDHWMGAPAHREARRDSVSVPHSNLGLLHQIDVPVRIVHGRFDRMVTVEQALMVMGYLPQADLVVLNRAGHWAPYERPADYVRHVLPFLLEG